MADQLGKAQSQLSHLIGKNPIKNIGDKVAREAELAFNKPLGWLDKDHSAPAEFHSCFVDEDNRGELLCTQVPLITWEAVRDWPHLGHHDQRAAGQLMVPTTIKVSPLAFALTAYCESMQAPRGVSFSKHAIIIADPDEAVRDGSFVICKVRALSPAASLKQLIHQGTKRYFRPLNPRFPIVECTADSLILGVVKQSIMNFHMNGHDAMGDVKKEAYMV